MENFLESIIGSIRIIGLIFGILGGVALIDGIRVGFPKTEIAMLAMVVFISALLLIISRGLSKRKKWAWYMGFTFSVIGLISVFFVSPLFKFFIGLIAFIIFFGLIFHKEHFFKNRNIDIQ